MAEEPLVPDAGGAEPPAFSDEPLAQPAAHQWLDEVPSRGGLRPVLRTGRVRTRIR